MIDELRVSRDVWKTLAILFGAWFFSGLLYMTSVKDKLELQDYEISRLSEGLLEKTNDFNHLYEKYSRLQKRLGEKVLPIDEYLEENRESYENRSSRR